MSEEMEIMDKLIFDITSGKYEPGDKLPSENELADLFKVPRITARKAYKNLQELGYIYSLQGRGSYVKDRQRQIPLILSGNVSFSEKMREKGYSYDSKNVFCDEIPFNKRIWESLGVGEDDRVFKVGRLRFVDLNPVALHISFIAQSVFPCIAAEGRSITSMFEYFRSKEYKEFDTKESFLKVTFPTKQERELMECSSFIPLLVVDSGCVDKTTGIVLECTKILYRSDYFTYQI